MKEAPDIVTLCKELTIDIEMKSLNQQIFIRQNLSTNHYNDFNKIAIGFFVLDVVQCQPELSKRKKNFV